MRLMHDAARRIEQLREHRGLARRERDLSINEIVKAAAGHAQRTHKRLGELIEIWERLLPPDLAARTAITSLRGGTAHVTVDSAATAYEIDRRLREGLQRRLIGEYRGTLLRIKVKQGRDGGESKQTTEAPRRRDVKRNNET